MHREPENYGIQRGYRAPSPPLYQAAGVMGAREERTWSALAHLSTFLNLFTGFLGPVAAFVVWLAHREKSPTVASHALRSVFYQVAWLVAIAVGWTITTALMAVLVGFLLVPVMIVVTLGPFVQASYEAYKAYTGVGSRYV